MTTRTDKILVELGGWVLDRMFETAKEYGGDELVAKIVDCFETMNEPEAETETFGETMVRQIEDMRKNHGSEFAVDISVVMIKTVFTKNFWTDGIKKLLSIF